MGAPASELSPQNNNRIEHISDEIDMVIGYTTKFEDRFKTAEITADQARTKLGGQPNRIDQSKSLEVRLAKLERIACSTFPAN